MTIHLKNYIEIPANTIVRSLPGSCRVNSVLPCALTDARLAVHARLSPGRACGYRACCLSSQLAYSSESNNCFNVLFSNLASRCYVNHFLISIMETPQGSI